MTLKIDESKFKYLSTSKLNKQYLTNFLTEIWNVPVNKLDKFIKQYYPNPSVMELVELNELRRMLKKNLPTKLKDGTEIPPEPLTEDDWKMQFKRYDRMYGKDVQPVELTGAEGKAIEINNMDKEELNKALKEEVNKVLKVMAKVKSKKNDK
jgi:hypothetical protein